MRRTTKYSSAFALCAAATLALVVTTVSKTATPSLNLPVGKVQLTSAGPLAFGPDGILFVGDSMGARIVAIDTQDTKSSSSAKINVQGIDAKIAALVGVTPDQIVINDVKVNPVSKNVYLSASRGKGPDAAPLIAKVDTSGKVSVLSLDSAPNESVSLVDAPATGANTRPATRMQTITDMNYLNGNVMVAGLSNEEWNSALRSIPFPFKTAEKGATLQIWHSSHGKYETQAPIRTFVPYSISGQEYVLAAYTCTPLVKIPVSDLKPGAQVKGAEIADLGAGNQPIDMVPYKKGGHDYILIANTSFGVVKLKADNIEKYPAIVSPQVTDVAGVPYDKVSDLQNVQHLAQLDASNVLVMTGQPGSGPAWNPGPPAGPINLTTVALP
ncbi:MAG TPA: hypothetical protein VK789_01995 [Bryobacteraceae bacterium]|jgi:hypothetical protein|nr:hypothetical protein [Bryobacteraceae bacterium]